jgi:ABC-type transport system substrate-binding protein
VRRDVAPVAIALALACVPVARAALGPSYGGRLRVALTDPPSPAVPAYAQGLGALALQALVHETLVRVGQDGFARPALADQWGSDASGREWTLRLREGATFHDGRAVDASAALASLKRFLASDSPAARHMAAALDRGAQGLAAPDSRHLTLRYATAGAEPLLPLAAAAAAITSSSGAGAGPFVPSPGSPTLRAFEGHDAGRPFLDAVDIVAVPDTAAAATAFAAGRADVAPLRDGTGPLAATMLLVLDAARPPFDDPAARAAVAGAFGSAPLVPRFLTGGDALPSLLPPTLLAPLPLPAVPPPARVPASVLMVVSCEVPPLVSQRVVAVLATLGIAATVEPLPARAAVSAHAPVRLVAWTPEVPEAGLALAALATLAAPPRAVADALRDAERTLDPAQRRGLLAQAESLWRAERVLVPLGTAPVPYRVRHGVHGVAVDMAGALRLDDAWVEP